MLYKVEMQLDFILLLTETGTVDSSEFVHNIYISIVQ
jgi:hypothetical protein